MQQAKLLNYGHAKVTSPTYIGVKEMFACTAQDEDDAQQRVQLFLQYTKKNQSMAYLCMHLKF